MQLRDLGQGNHENQAQQPALLGIVFESQVLNKEKVMLALKPSALFELKKHYPDLVVYFPEEIGELYKHKEYEETIRQAHQIKKMFGGHIVANKKMSGGKEHGNKSGRKRDQGDGSEDQVAGQDHRRTGGLGLVRDQ